MMSRDVFKRNETLGISTEERKQEIPKVIFDDLVLQVAVGEWLGILPSYRVFAEPTFFTPLDATEVLKGVKIPVEKLTEIAKKFGVLLRAVGIDSTETCILSGLDKNNFSFKCHFNNSGNDANISLNWGDTISFNNEITINCQNKSKTYEVWGDFETEEVRIRLQNYIIKNAANGNSCMRFLEPHNAYFELENGDYRFSIDITGPRGVKSDVLKIRNENQLQQYLLGLTFHFDINEVYKKICETSIDSIAEYPYFVLKVERKKGEKPYKTTDKIFLSYGQLKECIITKCGKTIAIDSDGNWSYSYESTKTFEELSNVTNPFADYNEVNQEIEKTKALTKSMLK